MVNHGLVDLHHWIHDFYMARPIDFVIMDGLQGIQNGPTPSKLISRTTDIKDAQMNMRLLLAGKDAIAVDTIASLVMGWDPTSVEHLVLLNKDRMGNLDTAGITVKGKRVDEVRKMFSGVTHHFAWNGEKITDVTSPKCMIKSAKQNGNQLLLDLKTDDARKIDVFIDNVLRGRLVTPPFSGITIELDDSGKNGQEVRVAAYDYYLNYTEVTAQIKKSR